ncbi:MAG: ADP-ribosylglycohydrolase family protein [Chloroflexi bacterium]|nr:ADP-ribosylglycohydrolase family protein [Chloroflexota bacterium]
MSRQHAEAILFGLAIGDALGYPVEFLDLPAIKSTYGPRGITELPEPALFSDDTQMALALAEGSSMRGWMPTLTQSWKRSVNASFHGATGRAIQATAVRRETRVWPVSPTMRRPGIGGRAASFSRRAVDR